MTRPPVDPEISSQELAAISSGRSTVEQRKYERERAEQALLQDVAAAFYSLLLAEENVAATKTLIELADINPGHRADHKYRQDGKRHKDSQLQGIPRGPGSNKTQKGHLVQAVPHLGDDLSQPKQEKITVF